MVGLKQLERQGKACSVRKRPPQKHAMGIFSGTQRHGQIGLVSGGFDQT